MNAHVIGAAQRLLELHVLNICLFLLDPVGVAQVHHLLDGGDVLVIVIRRVVAKHVHVKPRTFLDHRQPNPSGADDRDRLAGDFVAEKRQKRMPRRPLLFPHQAFTLPHLTREHPHHEKRELGGRFGKHVGGVGERNLVLVGVSAVDVVEPDRDLRHDF